MLSCRKGLSDYELFDLLSFCSLAAVVNVRDDENSRRRKEEEMSFLQVFCLKQSL